MSGFWGISDLSPIAVICTSAFTSLSVASLFYYRKAQAENVLKISKQIQKDNIDVQAVETVKTLTLGETNLAKLTDEQKAIAINKNWTLA